MIFNTGNDIVYTTSSPAVNFYVGGTSVTTFTNSTPTVTLRCMLNPVDGMSLVWFVSASA